MDGRDHDRPLTAHPDPSAAPAPGPGVGARAQALVGALQGTGALALARRRERRALVRLGDALARSPSSGGGARGGAELEAALEAVRRLDRDAAVLAEAAAASLDADRADYARVPGWLRPVVIARGLSDRCILRGRRRALDRARAAGCAEIGRLAQAEHEDATPGHAIEHLSSAKEARARTLAALAERRGHLERVGRPAVPAALPALGREAGALGKSLALELRGQLFPRLPALAGLAVGFWIANTFTDSSLSATLHSLGIGHGPSRAVRSETYRAMQFWLPLVAAALCSYAGGRLSALVARRYGPQAPPPEAEPPPGP